MAGWVWAAGIGWALLAAALLGLWWQAGKVQRCEHTARYNRELLRHHLRARVTAEAESARLVQELSQAKNTLRLAGEPLAAKEPVKAKTAAEVRLAVERVNAQISSEEKVDG